MKRLLLSLLLISFAGILFANKVELQDAKTVALNAYYQKLNTYHETVNFSDLEINNYYVVNENGETVYYVFNITNNGFIIISAEDAMIPILGYSFETIYSPDNSPENFKSWMKGKAANIIYLRENNVEATIEIANKWNELLDFNCIEFIPKDGGKSIEPLLTCTWDQGHPYNYLCPVNTSGEKAIVGCVATAMAQIMYYWRYPEQGNGSTSYNWGSYGTITANFGETTYDWDGMVDNPTLVNLPVALISFHAGVAVHMHYGTNSSGASSDDVPFALKYYFKYSNTCVLTEHQGISQPTWENYVKDELDENCPVYYSGFDPGPPLSGHAFVCDGYHSDNTFHFNWGWGGYMNGWFTLQNAGGFTQQQSIVRNIFPNDAAYPYGCEPDMERTNLVGSFEDGSGPQENYDPNANCSWLITPQTPEDSVTNITLNFVTLDTENDDVVTIYDGETTSDPVLGTYSGTTTPGDNITSTGNKMLVTFVADGDAVTGSGWRVEYSTSQPDWCSGLQVLTEPTGAFDDGSGDFWYNNYTTCMWKIQPAYAVGITLTFTEFDTEQVVDEVKIFDASNSQLLATYSGHWTPDSIPDPVFAESGELFITFQTDGAYNGPGWTAEWEIGNIGVDEQNESFGNLKVYPNPANNLLNISFSLDESQSFDIKLLSVTGEVVYVESTNEFSGNYVNTIDLSEIAKGVYFLNLTNNKGTVNRKVIIK
ncbi:MAG: C10 family peptidase [Bacteroidetes bacterium]|nr:C10 family peptidase [Bacteroidota bacterium]MBL7103131.1 C10 family peptidase [Bacteroidales bacterium]